MEQRDEYPYEPEGITAVGAYYLESGGSMASMVEKWPLMPDDTDFDILIVLKPRVGRLEAARRLAAAARAIAESPGFYVDSMAREEVCAISPHGQPIAVQPPGGGQKKE